MPLRLFERITRFFGKARLSDFSNISKPPLAPAYDLQPAPRSPNVELVIRKKPRRKIKTATEPTISSKPLCVHTPRDQPLAQFKPEDVVIKPASHPRRARKSSGLKGPQGRCFVSGRYKHDGQRAALKDALKFSGAIACEIPSGGRDYSRALTVQIFEEIRGCDSLAVPKTRGTSSRYVKIEREYAARLGKPVFLFDARLGEFSLDRAQSSSVRIALDFFSVDLDIADELEEALSALDFSVSKRSIGVRRRHASESARVRIVVLSANSPADARSRLGLRNKDVVIMHNVDADLLPKFRGEKISMNLEGDDVLSEFDELVLAVFENIERKTIGSRLKSGERRQAIRNLRR